MRPHGVSFERPKYLIFPAFTRSLKTGRVSASRISPENLRKIRIFQDDAYLSLDYISQEGRLHKKEGFSVSVDKISFSKDEPLKLELCSFVDCVKEMKEPLVSGQQGYYALKVAHQIEEIIKERNKKFGIQKER